MSRMIRIAISPAAFQAIAASLPLGSVGFARESRGEKARPLRKSFGRSKGAPFFMLGGASASVGLYPAVRLGAERPVLARRYPAKPRPAKPSSIIAHVEGSETCYEPRRRAAETILHAAEARRAAGTYHPGEGS